MITLNIGNCRTDILPVVKGLVSEAGKVAAAYGGYEAYAVALGIEDITVLSKRKEIEDEPELGELDLVYSHRLSEFGEVQVPTPAFCELIDLCAKDGTLVIPLDMNNDDFATAYIQNVKTTEFVMEHRMAKKGMKKKFDMSSPEAFSTEWYGFINKAKGFSKLSRLREEHIAEQIVDISRYRGSLLAVVETEIINKVLEHINSVQVAR
ncbi:MAG: hypothetical protein LBV63_03170 [Candidatus Methanoplasma sp.]|jgi:hypothetical protein|nr:hypothetical protein [Candidatus Methanoplasma sp.]